MVFFGLNEQFKPNEVINSENVINTCDEKYEFLPLIAIFNDRICRE